MTPLPCLWKRLRLKFASYEKRLRLEQGRAIEAQRQNDRLQGKLNDLERELRQYRDGRATYEFMKDRITLCIDIDRRTFRHCPQILDNAMDRLRHDFIKTAHRTR